MGDEREEAIKARAYQLWVESGYAHGHDKKHWQQAKHEVGHLDETDDVTAIGEQHQR